MACFTGRYAAHLHRQDADVRLFLAEESLRLQPTLDYAQVAGLSSEECERLTRMCPASIVSSGSIFAFDLSDIRGRVRQNGWKG
jgi:tRNA U34 5-carboxymethylaminomethyl modifying enzyme MnmG/GidA